MSGKSQLTPSTWDNMLKAQHQFFLKNFAKADTHYSAGDAPYAYFNPEKDLSADMISKGLEHPDEDVRRTAVAHPDATNEHIDVGLNDSSDHVRGRAANHEKTTAEQLERVMNDPSDYVRINVACNRNATTEQLKRLVDDPHGDVSYYAKSNLKLRNL